jgi:hypothetical protein
VFVLPGEAEDVLAPQHRDRTDAAAGNGQQQPEPPDAAALNGVAGAVGLRRQDGDARHQAHAEDQHQHMRREAGGEIGLIVGTGMPDHHQRHREHHQQAGAPEHHGQGERDGARQVLGQGACRRTQGQGAGRRDGHGDGGVAVEPGT